MKKISILVVMSLALAAAAFGASPWGQVSGGIGHAIRVTASAWPAAVATPAVPVPNITTPAGVSLTAASRTTPVSGAGVTSAAKAAMPANVTASAAEAADEGQEAYDSLTTTTDFNYRPAFVESKYEKNELFTDIAVSAVEAVPFGFLLTSAGIYLVEAAVQWKLQPGLKTLQDYVPVYAISIGTLAALNVLINTLFFYDYNKEDSDAKKPEEK